MTPDQIDELAQALYACLWPHSNFETSLFATQERYRNGVRVVLERAGQLGDSARVDDLVGLVAAAEARAERAERLEREFRAEVDSAFRKHGLSAGPNCVDRLVEQRDEQKARADRAVEDWKSANGYDDLLEAYGSALDRISALEKAANAVLASACLAKDGWCHVSCSAVTKLRAALDAPQSNQDGWLARGIASAAEHTSSARITPEDEPLHIPEPECRNPEPILLRKCEPIPDGILIAAAVYECTQPHMRGANGRIDLNKEPYAGLDYGLDLNERMRARKEARSK